MKSQQQLYGPLCDNAGVITSCPGYSVCQTNTCYCSPLWSNTIVNFCDANCGVVCGVIIVLVMIGIFAGFVWFIMTRD